MKEKYGTNGFNEEGTNEVSEQIMAVYNSGVVVESEGNNEKLNKDEILNDINHKK